MVQHRELVDIAKSKKGMTIEPAVENQKDGFLSKEIRRNT